MRTRLQQKELEDPTLTGWWQPALAAMEVNALQYQTPY